MRRWAGGRAGRGCRRDHLGHGLRGDGRRQGVQDDERGRELERGEHRPDRHRCGGPGGRCDDGQGDGLGGGADVTTSDTVYAGTDGGRVFKTTNGGGSWSAVNTGLTASAVEALAVDATMGRGTGWAGVQT